MVTKKKSVAEKPARAFMEIDPSGKLKTSGYRPLPHIYFTQPRDLPLFNHFIVRAMLMDPGIRLNLRMREAPLAGVKFGYKEGDKFVEGIQCRDEAIGKWVHRQITKIWKMYLPMITSAQKWGWSAGEITLKLSDDNLLEINKMEARHATDCRLILDKDRNRWGVAFSRIEDSGRVKLQFPYCWFHSYDASEGEFYGTPNLLGAYSPWADKWLSGGALDTRRLFMHKDAYGGRKLYYPEGTTFIDGVEHQNEAIARRIVEQIEAGGVATLPSTMDNNGNRLWELEEPNTTSNAQHILDYPKALDDEIRHGQEIPDDIFTNDGSGAWAGKRVPMAGFYASLDSWVVQILCDLKEQVLDRIIMMNWGYVPEYSIDFMPLAEQAMEQQGNAGSGDANPLVPGVQRPEFGNPFQMGLHAAMDPVDAVGCGVIDTASLVLAAQHVLTKRMQQEQA